MTQLIVYRIFSENDYGTTQGAEMSVTVNNSPIQDYSSCMFTLQAIMLHLLNQMTPGFKHFTVLYPTAIPSSGYLMTTKSLVCGVTIVC